ncbi:MAG TPA: tetratricopeptide repeat protein [Ramlibacter sp.]
MWTDSLGNPVTLTSERGLASVDDFVGGFISSEARAVNAIAAASGDDSPIVQAYAGAVHMFAESRDAPANAKPFIEKAQEGAARATPREQRFIAAVAAWADGDIPLAAQLHEEQAKQFPRDLASLKLGQYHLFNMGDAHSMLRIAMHAWDAARDIPYFHGMLAFGFEQCHRLQEAEAAARRAIDMQRKEPWAHHALAHVMLTQRRHREGSEFMRSVSDTWTGLNSFMVTHNWWHQALFLIELGETGEALHLYDTQVWGVAKDYSQDQVNAVSLLARLELAGLDVGNRWQDLADFLAPRTSDHVLPFLDVQYLYGLARAGRPEADSLMRNIEAHAADAPPHSKGVWQDVASPAARGLLAHARGDYPTAAAELDRALPRLGEIGGSHAQRDLFVRIHRDALARAAG